MPSRVTAMDIEKQEFRRRVRGYDPDEVRLYLEAVAGEVERLNLDNGRLLEEAGQLRRELEELRSRDRTLQQTLVTAQHMAEEMKERARGEGDLLLKEARLRADQMLKEARDQLVQLETEIHRSKFERQSLEQHLRGVLEQHLELLEMRTDASKEGDKLRVLPGRAGTDVG